MTFEGFIREHWEPGVPEDCTKFPVGGTNCLANCPQDMCPSCHLFDSLCVLWTGETYGGTI